jgi:adenylate kinase family enzyme
MDALYWEENWKETSDAIFTERVSHVVREAGQAWVIDGNYRLSRAMVWPIAHTVVWLDYPLWLIYWRLFRRSLKRIISREILWNNNRESVYSQFFAKDSLFVWAKHTYKRRQATYSKIIANNEYTHLQFFHFRHPRETDAFLKQVKLSAR